MTERMTDAQLDRELRAFLTWQAEDVAGAPSASEMTDRVGEHVLRGRVATLGDYQQRLVLALLVAAMLVLLIAAAAFIGAQPPPLPPTVQNGWIAYSTQPGYKQVSPTDWASGGDIYLVREGVEPRIIVERGPEMKSNVCPQFSVDGSLLVYGELDGTAGALVVLEVGDDGLLREWRRFALPVATSVAPCPRWSRDGTHIAYLDGVHWDADGNLDSPGTGVKVVDLNGATVEATADDPGADDLRRSGTFDPLGHPDGIDPSRSPDGERRATCADDGVVIGPLDGPADRLVPTRLCGYSLAAWSPDETKVLTLSDGGRHATMAVISVAGPPAEQYIARVIPVNGLRSWPGRGDVSWQPVYP